MPLWRGRPNTRTLPTVLLTPPPSKAADMAHLCVPQNQALGVCRGFVPDIKVCGTHGREDLVNATITSNAEEEEIKICHMFCVRSSYQMYFLFPAQFLGPPRWPSGKASTSRAEGPGFESRLRQDFFGVKSCQ